MGQYGQASAPAAKRYVRRKKRNNIVWPFKKKSGVTENQPNLSASSVLRVQLGPIEVSTVNAREVPVEKCSVLELEDPKQSLRFIDSNNADHSYDLSSIYQDNVRFLHLSVRVGPTFAVEADALLSTSPSTTTDEFISGKVNGVRFQPFYLPECKSNPSDLVGRGLFYRGLHFPGTVTRGNVSLLCICDICHRTFRLQSFHAGFSNHVYFYCSEQPHTLIASSYLEDAPPVDGKANPESVLRFESTLPPCEQCGGAFRYMNPLRCPHCRQPYIDFPNHPEDREKEYYGNYLFGGSLQEWKPNDA